MSAVEILNAILEILVGGITKVATGLGKGLSDLVKGIFFETTSTEAGLTISGLSVMGQLIIIFAGISLALGLCRWVLNFVSSLGQRNR